MPVPTSNCFNCLRAQFGRYFSLSVPSGRVISDDARLSGSVSCGTPDSASVALKILFSSFFSISCLLSDVVCDIFHSNLLSDILPNVLLDVLPDVLLDVLPDVLLDVLPVADFDVYC